MHQRRQIIHRWGRNLPVTKTPRTLPPSYGAFANIDVVKAAAWGDDDVEANANATLRDLLEKSQKLLFSAIAGLEDAHNLDRDHYGGRAYAPRRLDPHLMEDAA